MDAVVDDALFQTFDQLPRQKRRDADVVSTAIEKAVRNAVASAWGKRPVGACAGGRSLSRRPGASRSLRPARRRKG